MIARTFDFRVDGDKAADGGDGRLGFAVVLVGIALILSRDALADDDRNVVVVGRMNTDGAVIIDHLEAGARGETLFQVIVEVVTLPKDIGKITVVDVDFVLNSRPVDALQLSGDQSKDDDHDGKENSADADPG